MASPRPIFLFVCAALIAETAHAGVPSPETLRERIARQALAQAEHMTRDWDPGQRDCAGFIRYLYRTALDAKKPLWRDREGRPAAFLTADELVFWNFEPLTRNAASTSVRTGDVLVYYHSHKPADDAWHMMMILDPPVRAPSRRLAIYHNGERGRRGSVRKVWLDDLMHTAEKSWRPIESNKAFLGVFRWKGWKELYGTVDPETGKRAAMDRERAERSDRDERRRNGDGATRFGG